VIRGAGVEDEATQFGHDAFGHVTRQTDPSGATTDLVYSALGWLVHARQPAVGGLRSETVYRYGPDGTVTRIERPRGAYQDPTLGDPTIHDEVTWDPDRGRQTTVLGVNTAEPRTWRTRLDPEGRVVELEDPAGAITRTVFDERGRTLTSTLLDSVTPPRTTRSAYDRNGNCTRLVDPAGRVTRYRHDAWDRLREVECPGSGTRFVFAYGPRDQLEALDVIGPPAPGLAPVPLRRLRQTFDERGRLVRRDEGSVRTEFWYDRDSRVVRMVDQRGHAAGFTHDGLDRVRTEVDPVGNRRTYTYDAPGRQFLVEEREIDPSGAAPETYRSLVESDARGRPLAMVDPLGNKVTLEYDDRDLLRATTTPLGRRTEYEHDSAGNVVAVRGWAGVPPVEVVHRWTRDQMGRPRTYTDPEGRVTRYEYEISGHWRRVELADGRASVRHFDGAGQLVREILPSGTTVETGYGADGLPTLVHCIAGPGVLPVPDLELGHDGLGRPVLFRQGAASVEWAYTLEGRLARETAGATTTWTYDDAAGRVELRYPDGRVDRHVLDPLGRIATLEIAQLGQAALTGAGLARGAVLARYEYVGPDRLARRRLANGTETVFGYDLGRRPTRIRHADAAGRTVIDVAYVFDADGRRRLVQVSPGPGTAALHEFDGLSRLAVTRESAAASVPPPRLSQAQADVAIAAAGSLPTLRGWAFEVDRADALRRLAVADAGGPTQDVFALDATDRIRQRSRSQGGVTSSVLYGYDDEGRRTADHRFTYAYDALGRLREVRDLAGAPVAQLEYDPAGRISRRAVLGAPVVTVRHLGALALQEDAADGTPRRQLCWGLAQDELVAASDGTTRWAHQDARQSLLAVTDGGGRPIERYAYTPFGVPTARAGDGTSPLAVPAAAVGPMFGGHPALAWGGLYDACARAYDAETARFLQPDPRGAASSPDRYAYVASDPVDLIDPSGQIVVPAVIAVGVIIGAFGGAGYSAYDATQNPCEYRGAFSFRTMFQTFGGAAIGGAAGVAGTTGAAFTGATLGTGGTAGASTTAVLAGATGLKGMVAWGVGSVAGGAVWSMGFNQMFPEYVDPPSASGAAIDFVVGGFAGPVLRGVLGPIGSRIAQTRVYKLAASKLDRLVTGGVEYADLPTGVFQGEATRLGETTIVGKIRLNENVYDGEALRLALRHEIVHRWLSPLLGPMGFRRLRGAFKWWGYERSHTLRAAEEFMAQTFAHDSALAGWRLVRHPDYAISLSRVAQEIGIGGAALGLAMGGAWQLGGTLGSRGIDATFGLFQPDDAKPLK
jgi:RHS repeat-associated protein